MAARQSSGTRKSPQQQRSAEMVERIIDAGARVLLKYGYAETSTNKIAAEAKVSPGSLYYYFSDKDGVVRGVLDRFLATLGSILTGTTVRLDRPDRETFLQAADRMLTVLEENRRLLEILVNEAPRLVRGESRAVIEQRLEDHMRMVFLLLGSPLSGAELETRCWLATHLCLAIPVRYVIGRPPVSRAVLIDGLADQISVLAGLGPREATGEPPAPSDR